jgi:hypothetical protein
MNREVHVRICGSPGVRFPPATRRRDTGVSWSVPVSPPHRIVAGSLVP